MQKTKSYRFYLSIVFPSILAIVLFVISIFTLILPIVEQNIMERKKEMISELTHTVWSLLDEYNQDTTHFDKSVAQNLVLSKIEKIRYGGENKDYFWIIDTHPNMVMHPYRNELTHTDLSDYADPNGKKLFVEAVQLVNQSGEGFINYMWQWKDDSTRIVPKLSYVKAYEPWGWIIGTGIYLEDVKEEIQILKNQLLRIAFYISLMIALILLFIVRQSLIIEQKRKVATNKLQLSKQKYKSLVAASSEGTLMILNRNIIYSNYKFSNLCGYEQEEISKLKFENLFSIAWQVVLASFANPEKTTNLESQIYCKDGIEKEVLLSVSKIKYDEDHGYIIIVKEINPLLQIAKEMEHLSQDLQSSLLLMNQSIKPYIEELIKCTVDQSIQEAAELMSIHNSEIIFIADKNELVGAVNTNDLKNRVLAQKQNPENSVMKMMSFPVLSIAEDALLYEALLYFKQKRTSHLACKNSAGEMVGVVSYKALLAIQQNVVSFLIKEIETISASEDLFKIQQRLAVLVNALVESGDKPEHISRIITSISDAVLYRVVSLNIKKMGPPPCDFSFMVMGSEGRLEQTLATDQDNAIVFENIENEEDLAKAYSYFRKLGQEVCQMLNAAGYKLCTGNVMAQNQLWTQPLSIWQNHFSTWLNSSDPQSILESSIFFDFRSVYGNKTLVNDLRLFVNTELKHKPVFFYHLAQSIINYKAPVNIFGKIITESRTEDKTRIDFKKIVLPIISFVRLYALYAGISDTNTLERLKQLQIKQVIDEKMHNNLVLAYNYLMHIRFRSQAQLAISNQAPHNNIDIDTLTHIEISTIKKLFEEISVLQTKLSFDFKGSM